MTTFHAFIARGTNPQTRILTDEDIATAMLDGFEHWGEYPTAEEAADIINKQLEFCRALERGDFAEDDGLPSIWPLGISRGSSDPT